MMDATSAGATLYRGLRQFAADRHLRADSAPAALIDALAATVAWLVKNHGTAEVAYGTLHRVRRGDHSWPISGGESGGGMTIRAVEAKLEGNVFYGRNGQNWTQLVQFRRGAVRSWSATPYGQSDDPASPHYADQAGKLFSPGRLKPAWFQPADLEGNIESTQVLRRQPNETKRSPARPDQAGLAAPLAGPVPTVGTAEMQPAFAAGEFVPLPPQP